MKKKGGRKVERWMMESLVGRIPRVNQRGEKWEKAFFSSLLFSFFHKREREKTKQKTERSNTLSSFLLLSFFPTIIRKKEKKKKKNSSKKIRESTKCKKLPFSLELLKLFDHPLSPAFPASNLQRQIFQIPFFFFFFFLGGRGSFVFAFI